MKFHHVGIVVSNIQESLGEIGKYLQFDAITSPSLIGSQKVNVCFLRAGQGYVELIEPAEQDSPVSNFAKEGGGFHHICFEVKDIHKEIEEIVKKGGRLIVKPVEGFEGRLIAFVWTNMKNTKWNLVEYAEEKQDKLTK
jgi:methylmalonyl-CoA/ethylmalonyl-CoA epimerase